MKGGNRAFLVMAFYLFISVPVMAGEMKIYSSEGVQTIPVPGEETDPKGNWIRQSDSVPRQSEKTPAVKGAPPLLKITPLEKGKFLLEHNNKSFNTMDDLLIKLSEQSLGKSYRLGGTGTGNQGVDCSGFMKKVYQSLTLSLPHSSREQAKLGSLVTNQWDLNRFKVGDLLFFKRDRDAQIGHTGMYIGDGKMIHSASKKGVVVSNLKGTGYYNRNFVVAKRLFSLEDYQGNGPGEFKDP
jgi:hypothetical protein